MKNATQYVRPLAAFLKKLPRINPETSAVDPVTRLILGFLEWNATQRLAESAYEKLMAVLVDHNDLRVSHPHELATILGERYPRVVERSARLHDVLQAIFEREHIVALTTLEKKSRKDVQKYLDTLPGMVPYVSAQVYLLSFGGHAIPVDETMLDLLKEEEVIDPAADLAEVAGFLEKHVKAEDAADVHRRLRHWADSRAGKPARRK